MWSPKKCWLDGFPCRTNIDQTKQNIFFAFKQSYEFVRIRTKNMRQCCNRTCRYLFMSED